jgi:hypothetical protein
MLGVSQAVIALLIAIIWLAGRNKSIDRSVYEEDHDTSLHREEVASLPYRKKESLMTEAESNFNKVLREVVGDKYEIERQVVLSSFIESTTEDFVDYKTGRKFNPYRSKIDKKTIDFVLFDKADYTAHVAIELDDRSHERADRVERDTLVEDVLSHVGIRLVRIKTAYEYNREEIAALISG